MRKGIESKEEAGKRNAHDEVIHVALLLGHRGLRLRQDEAQINAERGVRVLDGLDVLRLQAQRAGAARRKVDGEHEDCVQ